jgi:hypothetical protein
LFLKYAHHLGVGLLSLQTAANFSKMCFTLAIQLKWRAVVRALHGGNISRSYRDDTDAIGLTLCLLVMEEDCISPFFFPEVRYGTQFS